MGVRAQRPSAVWTTDRGPVLRAAPVRVYPEVEATERSPRKNPHHALPSPAPMRVEIDVAAELVEGHAFGSSAEAVDRLVMELARPAMLSLFHLQHVASRVRRVVAPRQRETSAPSARRGVVATIGEPRAGRRVSAARRGRRAAGSTVKGWIHRGLQAVGPSQSFRCDRRAHDGVSRLLSSIRSRRRRCGRHAALDPWHSPRPSQTRGPPQPWRCR